MADASPGAAGAAYAASQSLRDTAKWFVGGIAATAVGVFAGSSLTRLGELELVADRARLAVAIGGLVLGFCALGAILIRASDVLRQSSMTLRELAGGAEPDIVEARTRLNERYDNLFPAGTNDVAGYVVYIDRVRTDYENGTGDLTEQASKDIVGKAERDFPVMLGDATFMRVQKQFDRLISTIRWAGPLAILGFGLFAWAANPPKPDPPPSPKPFVSLTIGG